MAEKPTHASVTDVLCTCDYLQAAADDPDNPIQFDQRTGEYQFKYFDRHDQCSSMLVIYHCPFCGGAAPQSKRALLFAVVPRDEEERIATMMTPIETIGDAIDKFGSPDSDGFTICRVGERDDRPPSTTCHREIRYQHLSTTADICIADRPDGKVHWQIQGKQL